MSISATIREAVRKRANFICEYCHSSEEASTGRFTMDHLLPRSLGGRDDEINLALACTRCNGRRYNFVDGFDPETQAIVRLFNPRRDEWSDHFIWSQDGQCIIAVSPIGRATLMRLDLNDDRHDDGSICRARRLWIRGGWHPPSQDPQIGVRS
jgi:HNH endonuclease